MSKQLILDALNSLEIIESNGGEEAYALFENNEENRQILNQVGITDEVICGYGDERTSCILAIAFGEGYAGYYDGKQLISGEEIIYNRAEKGDFDIAYETLDGKLEIGYHVRKIREACDKTGVDFDDFMRYAKERKAKEIPNENYRN